MSYDENAPILRLLNGSLGRNLTINTVNIPAGSSVSSSIDLGTTRLLRITTPIDWTTADLVLDVSDDNGVTFFEAQVLIAPSGILKGGRSFVMFSPPWAYLSLQYIRLRCVASDTLTPIPQAAARAIKIISG